MRNKYYFIVIAFLLTMLTIISTLSIRAENNRKEVSQHFIYNYLSDINDNISELRRLKTLRELSDNGTVEDFYTEIMIMTEIKEDCMSLVHHIQLKGDAEVTDLEFAVGDYFIALDSYILDVIHDVIQEDITYENIIHAIHEIDGFTDGIHKLLRNDYSNNEELYRVIVDVLVKQNCNTSC